MRSPVDRFSVFLIVYCISFVFPIVTQADGLHFLGLSDAAEPRFFPIKAEQIGPGRHIRSLEIDRTSEKSAGSSGFFTIDRDRPATHQIDADAGRPVRVTKPVAPAFVRRANIRSGNSSSLFAERTETAPMPESESEILAAAEPENEPLPGPKGPEGAQATGLHWPVDGRVSNRVSSRFGWRLDPFTGKRAFHGGLDIAAATGTRVLATMVATVKAVGEHPRLGLYVMLDHGHDLVSIYGHLSATLVSTGDRVRPGEVVGKVGSTGRSTGPHLDYSVEYRGKRVDPLKLLRAPIILTRG